MNDSMIIGVIDGLNQLMEDKFWGVDGVSERFFEVSMALACVFSLILVAKVLYKPLTGQGSIDFLAFGKPLLLGLIISNWFLVSQALFGFARPLESFFRTSYEIDSNLLDEMKIERLELSRRLEQLVAQKKAETEITELLEKNENPPEELDGVEEARRQGIAEIEAEYFNSYNPLQHLGAKAMVAQAYSMNWLEKLLLWVAEMFWAISIFLVFLIKHIGTVVMVMFGPIVLAVSILFEDSWKKWLGQSISVSMYGVIAFLVMGLSVKIIKYGIQADINLLHDTIENELILFSYMKFVSNSGFGTIGLYIVSLFCGGALVLMVPEMAMWVFPSKSYFSGASQFQRGVQDTMRTVSVKTAVFVAASAVAGPATGLKAASVATGNNSKPEDNPYSTHGTADGTDGTDGTGHHPHNNPGGGNTSTSPDGQTSYMGSAGGSDNGSQKGSQQRPSASSGRAANTNSWYQDILSDYDRMEQLRVDLNAFEEALQNGTADDFMNDLHAKHPEWNSSLDELLKGDERDRFWEELKQHDKRRMILDELDELLNTK